MDMLTEQLASYSNEINARLSFEDFREFCLKFLPTSKEFETSIKRAYRLEGFRTMLDALNLIRCTILFFHALKTNPGLKQLPKRKQIGLLTKMAGQYDESWIDDVPGMREVLDRNFVRSEE